MALSKLSALSAMTEKQRLIASIAVIAVGSAGLGTFWGFGLKEERALAVETKVLHGKLAEARQKLAGLDDLKRRHRDSVAKASKLAQLLPDRPELERVYEILEETERQAGKVGESVLFTIVAGKQVDHAAGAPDQAQQPFNEISLDLTTSGTWEGFVSFLDGLEHADRLIAVKSFKTLSQDKGDPLFYQYQVVLSVYTLKAGG